MTLTLRRTAFLSLFVLAACHGNRRPPPSLQLSRIEFETREEISTGVQSVADAILEDLDGDGRLDLAVTALSDQLQILKGAGNGTFSPRQTLPAVGFPAKLKAADLDLDSDLDLIVMRPNAQKVSVWLNGGVANFTPAPDLDVLPQAIDIAIGDCNQDGKPDLLVAHWVTSDVLVFAGKADGTFEAATNLGVPQPSVPSALAIADLDRDGIQDVAVAERQRGELVVLPGVAGGGHGTPTIYQVGQLPLAIAVGDIDRDTHADLVVSNFGTLDLTVFQSNGNGLSPSTIQLTDSPGNLLLQDVTGDKLDDLVVVMFERASVALFQGLPAGGFAAEQRLSASGLPYRPIAGDVTRDGLPDLLVTASGLDRLSLYRNLGSRLRAAYEYDAATPTPEATVAADFDGDGRAEAVVGGGGNPFVSILRLTPSLNGGPLTATPVLVAGAGRPVFNLATADLNADGRADIAVSTDAGVKILANQSARGQILFQPFPLEGDRVVAGGVGPFEVATADMDGDGINDLIVTDAFAQSVIVLRATDKAFGYETFTVQVPVAGTPGGLAVADFTGDRVPDVAVARNAAAVVTILANDGTGRLSELFDIPVGGQPNYMRTANFNGDARADLVVSNAMSDEVSVLLMGQLGATELRVQTGQVPTALLARDFNRDGKADILVASLSGADFRVLIGDGNGGFPQQAAFPGTYKATSADLADVDGDGLQDLLIASVDTTRLGVYRNISR